MENFKCGHCLNSFEGRLSDRNGDGRNEISYFFCNKCSSPSSVQYSSEPFSAFKSIVYGGKYSWTDVERELENNFKPCSCGGRFEKGDQSKCPHCGLEPFKTKEGKRLLAGQVRYGAQWMKTPINHKLTAMLMSVLNEDLNLGDHERYMMDLYLRYGICQSLAAFWNKPMKDMPPHPAEVLSKKQQELDASHAAVYSRMRQANVSSESELLKGADVAKLMAETAQMNQWWVENRSAYEKPWEEAALKEIENWKNWWNERA